MKFWWKQKRIDVYIAAVIIPSIILSCFALWALWRQYNLINYALKTQTQLPSSAAGWFGSFSQISMFAFAMLIFSLLLILIIASFLSSHNIQRQLELARMKSDFVSIVSHELKTPLTSIRLLAERLVKLAPEDLAKQKEYQNLILTQSYRLTHLINNILDFSKLEEANQKYKFELADLTSLIKDSIEEYPVKFLRPDCALEINLCQDLPQFYLDKESICRAFINLLDNALKFSPGQGVIKINVYRANKDACIEVIDQGAGIEEKQKKRLFERFYHTAGGTGLGLTIVRHIIQAHLGRIELESQAGKGSKFKLVLPLRTKV